MLTDAGKTFLVVGLLAVVAGIALGYTTLLALGLALLAAVVIGRLWIVRRPRVEASRLVIPERTRVGRPARSNLTISNTGRRRTAGGLALERFGESQLPVEVPSLEPGESVTIETSLPTDERGVFRVGPLDVTRADPFGLVRSGDPDEDITNLYIHPQIHQLEPFPSGIARDLEGPEIGKALEGGVTFHTLREYVHGDDLRQVHWRSSARTGKMMVRHNVDTHQPRSLVILDTRASSHSAESFEDAVRAAASVVAASMSRGFDFRLVTTDGVVLNQQVPAAKIMDRFAEVGLSFKGSIEETLDEVQSDIGGVSLTVVTGVMPAAELALLRQFRGRFDVITVAQFTAGAQDWESGSPDATLITAADSADFASAWNQVTRTA